MYILSECISQSTHDIAVAACDNVFINIKIMFLRGSQKNSAHKPLS